MRQSGASTWQLVLAVAGVVLILGLIVGGQLIYAGVLLVLLLIMGGGALLYRIKGPPEA